MNDINRLGTCPFPFSGDLFQFYREGGQKPIVSASPDLDPIIPPPIMTPHSLSPEICESFCGRKGGREVGSSLRIRVY